VHADTEDDVGDDAEMPPPGLVDEVARGLRRVLGLHLFNFDMIRGRKAAGGGGQYFIIDINYFSGFDKLPGYEVALTDFFDEMIRSPHTGSGRFYRRRNASKLFCGGIMGVFVLSLSCDLFY
jgi:hypothetical protein